MAKLYEVHAEYQEPTKIAVQVFADSAKEAIQLVTEKIRETFAIDEVTILEARLIAEDPSIMNSDLDGARVIN